MGSCVLHCSRIFNRGELLVSNEAFLVGNFVALMNTIFKFDTVILQVFAIVDDMYIGFVHIQKIAWLVNSETQRKVHL